MKDKGAPAESWERRERRERLYAALDRAFGSVQRAEDTRRTAEGLLDEARRILKQTRWTGARRWT